MKRAQIRRSIDSRLWVIVLLATALAAIGCGDNINVIEPPMPIEIPEARAVQVVGILDAETGGCTEATILYDGQEISGARTECATSSGCTSLEMESDYLRSMPGLHKVAFQVIHQSQPQVRYTVRGEVSVLLDPDVRIQLGPREVTLSAGESVTFNIVMTPRMATHPPDPSQP